MYPTESLFEHFDDLRTIPGGWDLSALDRTTTPSQPDPAALYEAHHQSAKFKEPRTIPSGWDLSELT